MSSEVPLPRLDPAQRLLLPVADAFMILMLSRPPSGTLRTTRVTVVSVALAAVSCLAFATAGVVIAISARGPLPVIAGALLGVFAFGCFALAAFGSLQRLHGQASGSA